MFEEILSRIAKCLLANTIPYMIIGGQAMPLYGEPRLAKDIDIVIGLDARCINVLLFIVQEMRLKPLPDDPRAFVKQTMVLPALEESTGARIDFILSTTPYEEQAMKRAVKVRVKEQKVSFATLEDVIIHKIFAGSRGDFDDVRQIIAKNRDIDIPYIRKWLVDFDKTYRDENFLITFEEICRKAGGRDTPYYY